MLVASCLNTPICNTVFHYSHGASCQVLHNLCERGTGPQKNNLHMHQGYAKIALFPEASAMSS